MDENQKEEIRQLIVQELTNKLKFNFSNCGYESMGLEIKIEFDGQLLVFEKI